MARFEIPKSPDRSILAINELRGVDLSNAPANVEDYRSPDAPNMIRDQPGKVRKRMGYERMDSYDGRINGVFYLTDDNGTREVVHAGNRLYVDHAAVYEEMADTRSAAWQFGKKLYLLDGRRYLVYGELDVKDAADGEPKKSYRVEPVTEIAYVPTIIISRNPDGAGTTLEPVNLLSRKWTESFYGKASTTAYQLTTGNLDGTPVTARKLGSDGTWQDLAETTDFTVDRKTGKVTFKTAPGASPVDGTDNVEITASKARGDFGDAEECFAAAADQKEFQLAAEVMGSEKVTAKTLKADGTWNEVKEDGGIAVDRVARKVTFATAPGASPIEGKENVRICFQKLVYDYADRINHCDVSILYGVNGAADRLFATGNPKYPNQDWYSQMNDPTFFGDLWYSVLGQDSSRILGYSVVNDRLAAHKDEGEDGRNVILRNGTLQNGAAAFPIVNALQGAGAVGKYTFAYLQNEPLFLTRTGIMAITPADITGERYAQNRSSLIDKALTAEAELEEAVGCAYQDLYILSVNGRCYVLDGMQKKYERNAPYSSFQYECYHWTNVPARIMWERDGRLWFGTETGQIYRFYGDPEAQGSYNDAGAPIQAHWDLPDVDGKYFHKNKTFRYFSVRLASAIATGVKVYAQKKGIWSLLFDAGARARYLDFGYIDFAKFTFSSDATPKTIGVKIKQKKVDKIRFRLENNELNEPFGLFNISLEFVENGNYKGG